MIKRAALKEVGWSLEDFVRESNWIEGIVRKPLAKEIDAHKRFLKLRSIGVYALEEFVHEICGELIRARPGMDVRVGGYALSLGGADIVTSLGGILARMDEQGPYRTHVAYEHLHPFVDGNGRSGRVLWLWQMGGEAPLGFLHKFYYQTLGASK